jgi:ubiquinone/menaquinone biosynthesis C-methylase UbiE
MLERACMRRDRGSVDVRLLLADAQSLPFPDGSFDTVVTTFVFCSIPDPATGLAEARRVLRPGGQLLLLEHVLSGRPMAGRLMRVLNPFVVRVMGANINRRTVERVAEAGFRLRQVDRLWSDIVVLIDAERVLTES